MSSAMLTQLLYCFCVLSALLLLGTLLRALIPGFRKLFLPASVIGGFVGLLIGPVIWKGGGVPFPPEWLRTWAALPGVLIVPVVAATPLGMRFSKSAGGAGRRSAAVIKTFAILFAVGSLQYFAGIIVRELFVRFGGTDLYAPFGYELLMGFSGGHGSAGVMGSYYRELYLPYWEISQGVTTTTATFGLLGGMIIGIVAINLAARRGRTAILRRPADIPPDLARGYQRDPAKQPSLGKETTMSSSIESLGFHLAIILAASGLAYVLMNLIRFYRVPLVNQIPIWAWAIMVMFAVNFLIQKLGLGDLVDRKTKSRIAAVFSDYAITAAIASLPVQALAEYILPILALVILGAALTYGFLFFTTRKFFPDYSFERGVALWGSSTGVFITGLMLLKICDPDYQSPVLNDYTMALSLTSITGFVLMPIDLNMLLHRSFAVNVLYEGALFVLGIALLFWANHVSRKS